MAFQKESAQFSVGSVEGVPFTACTSGPDIIILAGDFSRIQQIKASSQISSLDCSTDVGKIAAAYDNKMVIYEPIPLVQQQQQQQPQQSKTQQQQITGAPKLDYKWVQTATIESETPISVMSFNLEGTRLIAGDQTLQLWVVEGTTKTNWQCVWRCKTASNITYLKYSPDGTLFCSASKTDRLVKIWYESVTNSPSLSVSSTNVFNDPTAITISTPNCLSPPSAFNGAAPTFTSSSPSNNSNTSFKQKLDFSFIYIAHPAPVTGLEWRRTSKYTPRGAVANILITSCSDNIARLWAQTLLPGLHFHLAGVIEANFDLDTLSLSSFKAGTCSQTEDDEDEPRFVVHWINNKEIHITRSIELLLHDMLIRILRGNNNPASSSNNSLHSTTDSCSGSENDTVEIDDPNDDTITAETGKKLRHKLCMKMNKQRALAAAGRKNLGDQDDNTHSSNRSTTLDPNTNSNNNGRSSPTSLVEEFDKTLESLLRKWQMSADLLFSINKLDGTLTLWQVKYLDGEDVGIFRQVQIEKLPSLRAALPRYDATTMSLNITAYSPSAYLDVKRAYLAVTSSSKGGENGASNLLSSEQFSPVDVPKILSINADSTSASSNQSTIVGGSLLEMKGSTSSSSMTETEPSIFIVTQHLSGILGLWKMNFDSTYPKVQSVDLVTRITGLPIDPAWLRDGILTVECNEHDSTLVTKWFPDESGRRLSLKNTRSVMSPSQMRNFNFDDIKSSPICSLHSVDEESSSEAMQSNMIIQEESQINNISNNISSNHINSNIKDTYRASQMASNICILPQYHPKQLVELLAFGKSQRVKAILNHLVNCLVSLERNHAKEVDATNPAPWTHRSRTLSIVAQSAQSFRDSFDIDNPSSNIQQHVIEEIELDYIEVKSIRPLSLYNLLDADTEKLNSGSNTKSPEHEEFSTSYESILRARSQVDETLDEILGQSTIQTLNKQKDQLKRFACDEADKGSLTSFNPKKAKLLTRVLTHTHLPGLSSIDQMHLLAVADAVALLDASPDDLTDLNEDEDLSSQGPGMSTNIAIDSLDDRGLRFLMAMRQYIYLARCLPIKQRSELKASGIGNHNIVWAFHSESQDELISLIPCVQRNKPEWSELREFGVGWWVKKLEVVKKLIEKCAQSAYQARQDPLDAALFYLAMKKKTLVCALMRRTNCDKRLLKLFEQDFNDPVNRKKALKNAYALLGLHRFEHAAAFFILAGSIWDAVEVCLNNLNDVQLAIILIRLHDNDTTVPNNNMRKLLFTEILGSKQPAAISPESEVVDPQAKSSFIDTSEGSNPTSPTANVQKQYNHDPSRAHPDPFLRSMAFWKLGDRLAAVHTLLENDAPPSVVALLVDMYSDEAIAEKKRKLFYTTARTYLEAGCPLLALEVMCSKDQLNMSQAQLLKFVASLHILMNELNTLASNESGALGGFPPKRFDTEFHEWLRRSVEALKQICSYSGTSQGVAAATAAASGEPIADTTSAYSAVNESSMESSHQQADDQVVDDLAWIKMNEPILRSMLTYCNLHSATENSLTIVRLKLLALLEQA